MEAGLAGRAWAESSHASDISCTEHQSWSEAQSPHSWEGQADLGPNNSPGMEVLEVLEVMEVPGVEAMEAREIL